MSGGISAGVGTAARIPTASRARSALAALPAVAAISILVLIVGLHFGLVGAGQWEGDEYYNFGQLRASGWGFLWPRLVRWAPRPVSEGLIAAHWWAISATGRPLIAEFLAILWFGLIGAVLAGVRCLDRAHPLPRLLLGVSILASFLLGHTVAELFYWPMGAAAYLPTLAAIAYVAIAIVDGRLDRRSARALIGLALIVAAGSSEMGAMFVAALVPALVLFDRLARHARAGSERLPAGWAIAPFGVSFVVIVLVASGRAAGNLALVPDSATLHHFWPSVNAAVVENMLEFLTLSPGNASPAVLARGAAVRVSMFLGFLWCLRSARFRPVPGGWIAALVLALLLADFGSLFAAYDLFGFRCCLRHDTMRECTYVLILLALAALVRPHAWWFERTVWFGPAALVVAVLLAFGDRGSALAAAWRTYPNTIDAKEATWRDAARPGPEFEFRDQPAPLTGQLVWPAGRFTPGPSTPWYVSDMIRFFGKQAVRIAPPRADAAAGR